MHLLAQAFTVPCAKLETDLPTDKYKAILSFRLRKGMGHNIKLHYLKYSYPKASILYKNIYTHSVFCYDKHKKNFDIQFSLKRHETV